MATAYTDFLSQVVAGVQEPWQNVFVRLVSNTTSTAYISDIATSTLGKFTFATKPPADSYTVYTGPSNTGPWTATGDASYAVPLIANDSAAGSISVEGPNPTVDAIASPYNCKFDGTTDDTGNASAGLTKLFNDLNANNWTARFPHGTAVVSSSLPTLTNYRSSVLGPGTESCAIKYTGSGDCINLHENPFVNDPTTPAPAATGPKLRGFTIDGGAAAAGAVGLHFGDCVGGEIDVKIQHFNGAGSVGLWLENVNDYQERNRVKASLSDCTTGVKFSKNNANSGTVSFAYNEYDFQFEVNNGQTAMDWESASGSALNMYGGRLFAMANMAPTSTFIQVNGNSAILDMLVDLRVENNGSNLNTFASINSPSAVWRCHGIAIPGLAGALGSISAGFQGVYMAGVRLGTGNPGDVEQLIQSVSGHRATLTFITGGSFPAQISNAGGVLTLSNGGQDVFTLTTGGLGTFLTGAVASQKPSVAYSASVTPDASVGNFQTITPTDTSAFTINAPTNPPDSTHTQILTVEIANGSGGVMGAITWGAAFVLVGGAFTNPANGKKRLISFQWNGTSWIEIARSGADYTG